MALTGYSYSAWHNSKGDRWLERTEVTLPYRDADPVYDPTTTAIYILQSGDWETLTWSEAEYEHNAELLQQLGSDGATNDGEEYREWEDEEN